MSQFQQAEPISTGLPGAGVGCGASFDYYVGDSCGIPFSITDPVTGNPTDLTGWTLTAACRQSINPPSSIIFQKTSGSGGISLTNAAQGQGSIFPSEADTRSLIAYHDYWIDVVGRDGAGRVQTLTVTRFRAKPRVTAFPA